MKSKEKQIINEDIETIKFLIKINKGLDNIEKVAVLETELKRLEQLKTKTK